MAHFAIGDLQGCRREFQALLKKIDFGSSDHLWLLGDLVNRGPDSLGTMRAVMELRDQVTVVLGNHDLHFLAIYYGEHSPSRNDTFTDLLADPDVAEVAHWMTQQKLAHVDHNLGYFMSHAGVPHIWSQEQTLELAGEVEAAISGSHPTVARQQFFRELYGNEPDLWRDSLEGMPRLRMITNYLTRMRLVNQSGRLEFSSKGAPPGDESDWMPWYKLAERNSFTAKLLFGHWAALDGVTGEEHIIALDTGCVWGRTLTALCLETAERVSVEAFH